MTYASLTMKPPLCLTRLSQLGNGAVLYGLEYPGLSGGLSWCYLTIAKGVIIATQPETDCGTSLTNIWCQEFFEVLNEPVKGRGPPCAGFSTTTGKIPH